MGKHLISYDLKETNPSPHKAVLTAAEKEGLLYVIKGTDLHRLPNTTLWGVFSSNEEARDAFDRAIKRAEETIGRTITVEKRIVASIDGYLVKSDKRRAPDPRWTRTSDLETCRAHQLNDPLFR